MKFIMKLIMKSKSETRIVSLYIILGLSWIKFSDNFLSRITSNNHNLHLLMQTYKGWAYVITTAVIFYIILHRTMNNLRKQKRELQENYDKLEADNEEFQALNNEIIHVNNKLSMQKNQLNKIIDLVPHLIFAKDQDSNFIMANQAVADLYNTKPEKMINSKHNNYHSQISQKELDFFGKTDKEVINNNKKMLISEEYITDINGDTRIYQTEKIPFDFYDSDKKALLGVAVDITKMKEQEKTIKKYHKIQEEMQEEIILSIIKLLEIHDSYTKGHSQNVGNLAKKIAIILSLSEKEIKDAYWSGIVHDIGKILISKSILNKKGKLSVQEYNIIKKHPHWGYETLVKSNSLKHIAKYVKYHHERWDGSGYPEEKKQDNIPLISQIICLADSWDAMCSSRPYRKPLSRKAAINEVKINKGKQFSPNIVDAFLQIEEHGLP